jgi:anti-anti-sigma factor
VEESGVSRQGPLGDVQLSGEIDISNVDQVKSELEEVFRETGRLAIDTSAVSFMDSQGLRMIIQLGAQAVEADTVIQIVNCSPQVQRLFDLSVPNGLPGVEIMKGTE